MARNWAVTELTYPSSDGRKMRAVLSMPSGDGPFPVVVTIHGGQGNRDLAFIRTLAVPGGISQTVTMLNEQPWAVLAISYPRLLLGAGCRRLARRTGRQVARRAGGGSRGAQSDSAFLHALLRYGLARDAAAGGRAHANDFRRHSTAPLPGACAEESGQAGGPPDRGGSRHLSCRRRGGLARAVVGSNTSGGSEWALVRWAFSSLHGLV